MSREIDRDSPVPPSRQVAGWLREDIASGKYPPDHRLPSLNDLVQAYGIGRDTAKKVQQILVDEGLAYVEAGMGLFVAARP